MPDCSELGLLINNMALNIASRPGVKNIDDVVTVLSRDIPVRREDVVEAIVLANQRKKRRLTDLQNQLAEIKREARGDRSLRKQITRLEEHLAGKTAPSRRTAKAPPEAIRKLREQRDALRKAVQYNRPEVRKKIKARIAELEQHIKSGTFPEIQVRKSDAPQEILDLRAKRDALRKKLAQNDPRLREKARERIKELERHIKEGTLPETKARRSAPDDLKALNDIRDSLQKKLSNSEPAVKKRLQAQIAKLNKQLENGVELPVGKDRSRKFSAEIERLELERDLARRKIDAEIRRLRPKTVFGRVVESFNAARTLMTSFDLSAVLRQGGFTALGHPVRALKNFPDMRRALTSEAKALKIHNDILKRDNAPLYRRAKLYIAEPDAALSQKEEAFMSNFAERIPIIGRGVKGSGRAYTTFLNKLRVDTFDSMMNTLAKDGAPTQEEIEAIANFVNVATGRGSLGKFEQAGVALNSVFFAPKYAASRFQLLLGQPLAKKSSLRVKKEIAKEYARFLAGLSSVYALASAAGASIETNPRSSDFGKIKIGNTRLDPLSGLSQASVLTSRLATGETKTLVDGKIRDLSRAGAIGRFLRTKLAPLTGTALDLGEGKNIVGEPVDAASAAQNLIIPLSFREIKEAMEEQGVPEGAALGVLALFGMGMQSFDPKN